MQRARSAVDKTLHKWLCKSSISLLKGFTRPYTSSFIVLHEQTVILFMARAFFKPHAPAHRTQKVEKKREVLSTFSLSCSGKNYYEMQYIINNICNEAWIHKLISCTSVRVCWTVRCVNTPDISVISTNKKVLFKNKTSAAVVFCWNQHDISSRMNLIRRFYINNCTAVSLLGVVVGVYLQGTITEPIHCLPIFLWQTKRVSIFPPFIYVIYCL